MKPHLSLDELLEEIDRVCPPESPEEAAERRERVRKKVERTRTLQRDIARTQDDRLIRP